PPGVVATSPAADEADVAVGSAISVVFDEPVVPGATVTVTPSGGTALAGSTGLSADGLTLTLSPSAPLAYATQYQAMLAGAHDAAGNAAVHSWTFTTEVVPTLTVAITSHADGQVVTGSRNVVVAGTLDDV